MDSRKHRQAIVLKLAELAQFDQARIARTLRFRAVADFHHRNAIHARAQGKELLDR